MSGWCPNPARRLYNTPAGPCDAARAGAVRAARRRVPRGPRSRALRAGGPLRPERGCVASFPNDLQPVCLGNREGSPGSETIHFFFSDFKTHPGGRRGGFTPHPWEDAKLPEKRQESRPARARERRGKPRGGCVTGAAVESRSRGVPAAPKFRGCPRGASLLTVRRRLLWHRRRFTRLPATIHPGSQSEGTFPGPRRQRRADGPRGPWLRPAPPRAPGGRLRGGGTGGGRGRRRGQAV